MKSLSENVETKRKILRKYFRAAAIILILGLIIWFLPSLILGGITARINQLEYKGTLSTTDQDLLQRLQYSRNYWETIQLTFFEPIAIIILIVSLILFAYGFLIRYA